MRTEAGWYAAELNMQNAILRASWKKYSHKAQTQVWVQHNCDRWQFDDLLKKLGLLACTSATARLLWICIGWQMLCISLN